MTEVAPGLALPPAMRDWIARQLWPGNVRELRNVLTRFALTGAEPSGACGTADTSQPDEQPVGLRKAAVERIRKVHARLQGNVSLTARQLGVSRNTVYRALR
jgi:transcriptional regulator of acetoin/glycerol metabolism